MPCRPEPGLPRCADDGRRTSKSWDGSNQCSRVPLVPNPRHLIGPIARLIGRGTGPAWVETVPDMVLGKLSEASL